MAGKKIWAQLSSSVQPWCLQKRDIGTLSLSLSLMIVYIFVNLINIQ